MNVDFERIHPTPRGEVDPIFRACFFALPLRTQRAIVAGNPIAVKQLHHQYDLVRTQAPNRAARRRRT